MATVVAVNDIHLVHRSMQQMMHCDLAIFVKGTDEVKSDSLIKFLPGCVMVVALWISACKLLTSVTSFDPIFDKRVQVWKEDHVLQFLLCSLYSVVSCLFVCLLQPERHVIFFFTAWDSMVWT